MNRSRFVLFQFGDNQPRAAAVWEFLEKLGYNCARYASGGWLLVTPGEKDADELRSELKPLMGAKAQYVVLKIEGPAPWAARVALDRDGLSPSAWLHETWGAT